MGKATTFRNADNAGELRLPLSNRSRAVGFEWRNEALADGSGTMRLCMEGLYGSVLGSASVPQLGGQRAIQMLEGIW